MYILYSNYYITFIILFILFSRYQASENNVAISDGTSLGLTQNHLPLKNSFGHDSFVHSQSGISKNNYLRKRQIENKGIQREQKSFLSKKNNYEVKVNKRQAGRTLGKRFPGLRPPGIRPPYPRQPNRRPPARKTTPRRPPLRRTTPRRLPNRRQTTRKPGPRPTPPKRTTKKQITSKRPPPRPSVRPPLRPPTPRPTTTKRATTTTRRTTRTAKPDEYARLKSQLISNINDLRLKHQAKKLTVNTTLANKAQNVVGDLQNRINSIDGNSIGWLLYFTESEDKFNPLPHWTTGSKNINYNKLDEEHVPDSFAQLVWVSTTDIGCGISKKEIDNGIVTICMFYPRGNIQGEYSKNVKPEK